MTHTVQEDQCTLFILSRSVLLRVRNVSDKSWMKIKTHILCSITFLKNSAIYEMYWKYGGTRQATDDNMVHAHCMLDNWGYKHPLAICNTYCSSTATMVAWTCLIVALYLHFLSCFYQVQPDDIHMMAWQSVPIFVKTVRKFIYCFTHMSRQTFASEDERNHRGTTGTHVEPRWSHISAQAMQKSCWNTSFQYVRLTG